MPLSTRIQLSIMMFLEFFIWGAWAVTLGSYLGKGLGFDGVAIGGAYSTTAWAAIVSPFFIGMIADRFLPAQIALGVLHLLGAALMYWATTVTDPLLFFWVLLGYALCYMPTLALINAISFNQMTDIGKQFPGIRVWGTIGWIVAGLVISFVLGKMFAGSLGGVTIDATDIPLKMAAVVSVVRKGSLGMSSTSRCSHFEWSGWCAAGKWGESWQTVQDSPRIRGQPASTTSAPPLSACASMHAPRASSGDRQYAKSLVIWRAAWWSASR